MMNLEKMKQRKKQLHLTNQELAQRSGVPLGTINKIFSGATKSPKYTTLLALERVLGMYFYYDQDGPYVSMAREKDGRCAAGYTAEDYYGLQERMQAELIDGQLYYMTAPGRLHQELVGELHYRVKDYIRKNRDESRVYTAPFPVELDGDGRTVVQPDLAVVCRRELLDDRGMKGAPDFVAEVVSGSDGKRDYALKLRKYWNGGVKEYWVVDPFKKTVVAYRFQGEEMDMKIYGFQDKVPVGIFEDLVIGFGEFGG